MLVLLTVAPLLRATLITQQLYINADSLSTVDSVKLPYYSFNDSPVFAQRSVNVELNVGDSLQMFIANYHDVTHHFQIQGISSSLLQVMPGDTQIIIVEFSNPGIFIYHDPLDFPVNTYMGLAGMIIVKDHTHKSYYWNIKEHESDYNVKIDQKLPVDWTSYVPKYFTVNALSNPHINGDPLSRITGNVGDTIMIYMVNTGMSIHSIHFHGFHVEIVQSSKGSKYIGRSKDTVPLHSMHSVILKLIPDKPGEYPLHNHNLVAVTGNLVYPNGLFSTMMIYP